MGARDGERGLSQQQQKKIDDSEGMCGSESGYDNCWSRICNPDRSHVLKDVLRGLLVLIILAIVITVIFLLCYFLITDIENKEENAIDNLVKDFAAGEEELIGKIDFTSNPNLPTDAEVYSSQPGRGDLGTPGGARLRDSSKHNINIVHKDTKTDVHEEFAPSAPIEGPEGGNVAVVNPPLFAPTIETKVESKIPQQPSELAPVIPKDGFIPVVDYPENPQRNDLQPPSNVDAFIPGGASADYDIYDVFDNPSEFIVPEITNECVPLRLPICSSSMPWALSAFPNWVNNNDNNQLQESFKYFQGTVIDAHCSPRALEYSCAILEPACGPDGIPLPPCKSFCDDIARACGEYLVSGNEHNSAFQCDRFPDSSNPNVCVNIKSATPAQAMPSNIPKAPPSEVEAVIPSKEPHPNVAPEEPKVVSEIPVEIISEEVTTQSSAPVEETTTLPVFICDHTKFLCEDGSDCLELDAVCDGAQNCLDNSDELNCTKPAPTPTFVPVALLTKNTDVVADSPSRRPSLSDMLSGSSLVAVPDPHFITEPTTTARTLRLRFSSTEASRTVRSKPKSFDLPSRPKKNSFLVSSKPENRIENEVQTSPKLSLASLLSSTSLAPSSHRTIGSHSVNRPTFAAREVFVETTPEKPFEEVSPRSSRKGSLSDLLSTAVFRASPSEQVSVVECSELKCLDGKCISLQQLNDGVLDCIDGSDEFSSSKR